MDVAQRSFAVLKPGGRAAFIASGAQTPKPERSDVTVLRPPVERGRRPLEITWSSEKRAKVFSATGRACRNCSNPRLVSRVG